MLVRIDRITPTIANGVRDLEIGEIIGDVARRWRSGRLSLSWLSQFVAY